MFLFFVTKCNCLQKIINQMIKLQEMMNSKCTVTWSQPTNQLDIGLTIKTMTSSSTQMQQISST